jgi:hypothetical protein
LTVPPDKDNQAPNGSTHSVVSTRFGIVLGAAAPVVIGWLHEQGLPFPGPLHLRGKKKQRFARGQISAVLIDDGHLVLRDERDADLIREKLDVPVEQVATALRAHDWPIAEE